MLRVRLLLNVLLLVFLTIILSSCWDMDVDDVDMVCHIESTPSTIERSQSVAVSWWVDEYEDMVESARISDNKGGEPEDVGASGTKTFTPETDTTYTVTWTARGYSYSESVDVTVVEPPTVSLNASATRICENDPVTLTWTSTHAETCTLNQEEVPLNDSGEFYPTAGTTTYTIAAEGPAHQSTQEASVTITVVPLPTATLTVDKSLVEAGDTVTLTWSTVNAASCSINGIESPGLNDSRSIEINETTSFTLTAENSLGCPVQDSVTITVVQPPTVTLSASETQICENDPVTLTWTSSNAETCTLNPGIGDEDLELNGTREFYPPVGTTTYTMTAEDSAHQSTREASVTITVVPLPTATLTADKSLVEKGDTVTLTWVSVNASSCSIDGVDITGLNDSTSIEINETTVFALTAENSLGCQVQDLVTVTVVEPPQVDFSASSTTINPNESVQLSWTTAHAASCTLSPDPGIVELNDTRSFSPIEDTTYTLECTGLADHPSTVSDSVTIDVLWPTPTVELEVTPETIEAPASASLGWTTQNATYVVIDNGIGQQQANGSYDVQPSETTTYTVTAYNPEYASGPVEKTVTVTHKPPQVLEFKATPSEIQAGENITLAWEVAHASGVFISHEIGEVDFQNSLERSPSYTTTYKLTATSPAGTVNAQTTVKVLGNPPQPLSEGTFGKKYESLVPDDASLEAYDEKRFVILTGNVNGEDGLPLADVSIEVFEHPEYGSVLTDSEGLFSIPAEGGATLKVTYNKEGYITSHRQQETGWSDIYVFDPVTLIQRDKVVTQVEFDGNPETIVTHKSSEITDDDGTRSCSVVFTGDNMAYEVDQNGNRKQTLDKINVTATEYTTPESMPSVLPPTSAFTYCVELDVEGVERVKFDKPVFIYINNFIGFDVGTSVPVGWYDRDKGVWVPSDSGVVVQLLDTDGDERVDSVDIDGDGDADEETIGLNDPETYSPGTTYSRIFLDHFTAVDPNFAFLPPPDAITPNSLGPPQTDGEPPSCFSKGTLVHTENGTKTIETIDVNDQVWSFDNESDSLSLNNVLRLYATPGQFLFDLTFINEEKTIEKIRSTHEHPFFVVNKGWTPANQLVPGNKVYLIDGQGVIFQERKPLSDPQTVYNLEIENDHSFFVGNQGLLVHNACTGNVDPEMRVLHQDIPIAGTDMTLHYASNRVDAAYFHEVTVPVSGETVPASLKGIIVKLTIAGKVYQKSLPPLPNQKTAFVIENKDYLGNAISGRVGVKASIAFTYRGEYGGNIIFGGYGNGTATRLAGKVGMRGDIGLWKHQYFSLNIYSRYEGDGKDSLGEGWTLSDQCYLNPPNRNTLFRGDGTMLSREKINIINTVAGNGNDGYTGDGGLATNALIDYPSGIATDSEGNIYFAQSSKNRIRKIDTNGIITTIVGTGDRSFDGDGKLAINAKLNTPQGLFVSKQGEIYIADTGNYRVRKVDVNGIITTVAGNGISGYSGENIAATETSVSYLSDVIVDNQGNVFISESAQNFGRIRKIDTNGNITTVAGNGVTHSGYWKEGVLATTTTIHLPNKLAIDREGNIYFSSNHCVAKVDTSGIITTVAGDKNMVGWMTHWNGDDRPALGAYLFGPRGLEIDEQGNLFIADCSNYRIRMVDTTGMISTIAGTGAGTHAGDGGPATLASFDYLHDLALDPKGNLYLTNMRHIRKVDRIAVFSSDQVALDEVMFSENNGLAHIVSRGGQHKRTVDIETGVTLREFQYEGDLLRFITDQFGKQVEIEYLDETHVNIISPYGLITKLTLNSNKRLERVTYPDETYYEFEYYPDGLMLSDRDPEDSKTTYLYNTIGRLTDVNDSEEGHWNYNRDSELNGQSLTTITSGEQNRTITRSHKQSTERKTYSILFPSNDETNTTLSTDELTLNRQEKCGMETTIKYGVDSDFLFKYLKTLTVKSPGGLTQTVNRTQTHKDTSGDDIPDFFSETVTTNGKSTTLIHNVPEFTKTVTTPEGRIVTATYDPETLQKETLSVTGLNDVIYEYYLPGDLHYGKLHYVKSGHRVTEYTYYNNGNVHTVTDPDGNITEYTEYDPLGRVKTVLRPDQTTLQFEYDNNGNLAVLTNPSDKSHGFFYNGVEQRKTFTTPLGKGYEYRYDKDRRLTGIIFPSTLEINYVYDDGTGDKSLLRHIITPESTIDYIYDCGSRVKTMTMGSQSVTWGYDGSLVTSETVAGDLNQTIGYTYEHDGDFDLDIMTYAGASYALEYDYDGLLVNSGDYTINRKPENGLPDLVTGGALTLDRDFSNGYGESDGETWTVAETPIGSWQVTGRYPGGRIREKTETFGNETHTYVYTYDDNGRLATVTNEEGTLLEDYGYDQIPYGTCNYRMNTRRGIDGETLHYDDDDRILDTGTASYIFDEDGFLDTKTQGSEITSYTYSHRGELLSVTLPDETRITYSHDPLGRRMAKYVNGDVVERYLWSGLTTLLAVYDGAEPANLLMRFDYADGRMPVSMTKGGETYYLAYDQTGSLKAVADVNGNVVKIIDYDSFGYILSDSNESFEVPFGFAGGLHDRDTGLVRFGYRDYDPEVGRWTAKDPIDFAGGDSDLYGYVLNDPVNFVDPWGLTQQDLENAQTALEMYHPEIYNPNADVSFEELPPGQTGGTDLWFDEIKISEEHYSGVLEEWQKDKLIETLAHEYMHTNDSIPQRYWDYYNELLFDRLTENHDRIYQDSQKLSEQAYKYMHEDHPCGN